MNEAKTLRAQIETIKKANDGKTGKNKVYIKIRDGYYRGYSVNTKKSVSDVLKAKVEVKYDVKPDVKPKDKIESVKPKTTIKEVVKGK